MSEQNAGVSGCSTGVLPARGLDGRGMRRTRRPSWPSRDGAPALVLRGRRTGRQNAERASTTLERRREECRGAAAATCIAGVWTLACSQWTRVATTTSPGATARVSFDALGVCEVCGKSKRHVRSNRALQKQICPACYVRCTQRWRPCVRCREVGLPALRLANGSVCKRCYRTQILLADCVRCGKRRPSFRRTDDGSVVCRGCSDRHYRARVACSLCLRRLPAKAMPADKPVCGACYRRLIQPKQPCAICRQSRIVAIRLPGTNGICSKCYFEVTHVSACGLCGATKRVLDSSAGRACLRCLRRGGLKL
jgi:hypothetical protein